MTFLFDVNVLIALLDPVHVDHDLAHRWFEQEGSADWATCPLTENGVMRIVGHPRYPNTPGSPALVRPALAALRDLPGHIFWSDEISLLDPGAVDAAKLLTSAQVTDSYLLALAAARGGMLATFDRRIAAGAVKNGKASLHVIRGGQPIA